MGAHSAQTVLSWGCPRVFDADRVAAYMTQSPDAWSDGSLVLDSVSGASVAGSGIYSLLHGAGWACGHVDQVRACAMGGVGIAVPFVPCLVRFSCGEVSLLSRQGLLCM